MLRQAQPTRNAIINSTAVRNKLALSGIAEYAVRLTLASGLLGQSNDCVVFPTGADLAGFATATTGTFQQGVAVRERAERTAEIGRDRAPGTEKPPRATIEPPVSTTYGAGWPGSAKKGTLEKDDAAFVNLLMAPHASHEVRSAILCHTISQA